MRKNLLEQAVAGIGRRGDSARRRSDLAEKYFLNPIIPRAIQDDPDGAYHLKHQITDEHGKPYLGPHGRGLKKGDPIPLMLRWYQREVIDYPHRRKALRFGRRTGKSFTMATDICIEAVTNPKAQILILTPYESQIKMLFDDYIKKILATYRHQKSSAVGLEQRQDGGVPAGHDLAIVANTKKPWEIVLTNGVTIRGMVMTPGTRGQSATYVVIDEADYADNSALKSIVAPVLMTYSDTKVIMGSTPTGRTDSYFYRNCHSPDWKEFHRTFEVLPHFDDDLWDLMASEAGGENTNTFKREYLAEWGAEVAGVFDQKRLNLSFYVAPYARVLEDINKRTRERVPIFAHTADYAPPGEKRIFEDYRIGARGFGWDMGQGRSEIGSESVWQSPAATPGVITVGTDWNEHAGMQTVMIWWPDPEWLKEGHLKVARFDYKQGQPVTSDRSRDRDSGAPAAFTVGSTNGDPGGLHDLSAIEGIVIWHGRLESGYFNWQTAANRVISMMAIPDFIDTWYVDYGYGSPVLKMIEGIMASSQYIADGGGEGGFLPKAVDIPDQLMRNVLKFHPDQDFEITGKLFKSVNFGKPYPYLDFGYAQRGDLTKDVLISLAKQKIFQRKILIPYGELHRLATSEELGAVVTQSYDGKQFGPEEKTPVESKDVIEETGADTPKGEGSYGGLVHQLRGFKESGRTTTGRPRYEGADHAIDAFMLAILAYQENYANIAPDNIARKDTTFRAGQAESILRDIDKTTVRREKPNINQIPVQHNGEFSHRNYSSEQQPLEWLRTGKIKAREIGTSLDEMLEMANRYYRRRSN